jgi:hypothetical protein
MDIEYKDQKIHGLNIVVLMDNIYKNNSFCYYYIIKV